MSETLKYLKFERDTVAKCLNISNYLGGAMYKETQAKIVAALDVAIEAVERQEALQGEIMHQDVIDALNQLIGDRKAFIDNADPECPFKEDVKNLECAIRLIREKDASDKEAVHWMIIGQNAAVLLKGVQAYCPGYYKAKIDEFLKSVGGSNHA